MSRSNRFISGETWQFDRKDTFVTHFILASRSLHCLHLKSINFFISSSDVEFRACFHIIPAQTSARSCSISIWQIRRDFIKIQIMFFRNSFIHSPKTSANVSPHERTRNLFILCSDLVRYCNAAIHVWTRFVMSYDYARIVSYLLFSSRLFSH